MYGVRVCVDNYVNNERIIMRHGSSPRRQRNRGNSNRRGNQKRSQVFDSNGPDVRIRGTAFQVTEKYDALAKDALSAGDFVMAESYRQHAEHYQRIISAWESEQNETHSTDSSSSKSEDDKSNEKPHTKTRTQNTNKDDLSLPTSILGEDSKENSTENAYA